MQLWVPLSLSFPLFLFALLPQRRGGMQNFIPPLVSSERKGTPHGRWSLGAGVYKSSPPATPSFQNHHNTFSSCSLLQQLCVLFQLAPVPAPGSIAKLDRARTESGYSYERMMMDREMQLVRQCDMEVMKMAMLKHEETFRQQVHELHRLYRIQRELMSDLTGRDVPPLITTTRRRTKQPRRALDLQLPADEYIVSADEADEDAVGTELELTLAVGGRSSAAGRRKNNSRRRQRQAEQRHNAGSPFGSDCSGASIDLSTSPPSSAEYYSDDGPAPVAFHVPPPPPPQCQRAVAAFDLGEGMMMRHQHAPWLLQCQQYLSLRMT